MATTVKKQFDGDPGGFHQFVLIETNIEIIIEIIIEITIEIIMKINVEIIIEII